MIIPTPLGFIGLTQWGGMYSDGWCGAEVKSKLVDEALPPLPPEQAKEWLKSPTSQVVFSAPMHTQTMCLAWGQSWCNVSRYENAVVYHVRPWYRKDFFYGEVNVCDLDRFDPPWYIQD